MVCGVGEISSLVRQKRQIAEVGLVAQDCQQVMVYRRLPDGWEQLTYGAGETMELDSIGLALPLGQIYEDVPDDLVAGNE